jgi:hypothetical protein
MGIIGGSEEGMEANERRTGRQIVAGLLLALVGVGSGCSSFLTGDPERDQARVIAESRTARAAQGAADAADEQRERCASDDSAENDDACPEDRRKE